MEPETIFLFRCFLYLSVDKFYQIYRHFLQPVEQLAHLRLWNQKLELELDMEPEHFFMFR